MYSSIIRAIEMNGFSIVIRRRGAQNGSQSFSINLERRAARNVVDAERCQRVAALGRANGYTAFTKDNVDTALDHTNTVNS